MTTELSWQSLPPQTWPPHTEAPPEQVADWLTSLTREQLVWFLSMKRLDWAKDADCFLRNHDGQIRDLEDRLLNRAEVIVNPAIQSGEPCVGGHRISVENVVGTVWWYGVAEAEFSYDLPRPQILVACWYAAVLPVRIWGRGGVLKAQRNPWPPRWRDWADAAHPLLWKSEYDKIPDPPQRPGGAS